MNPKGGDSPVGMIIFLICAFIFIWMIRYGTGLLISTSRAQMQREYVIDPNDY